MIKRLFSFFHQVAGLFSNLVNVKICLQENEDGEVVQQVSVCFILYYGASMLILGVVVSYIFYFAAVLRAEADFSERTHIAGMKEVVLSLESGEATFSEQIRIQKKLVGEITGLAKDGMPAEVLPVYNLVIYGPDARLVLNGRRMISRDEFTFQVAVMAGDSAQVLIEEGWEPSAPGSTSVLFALQEAVSEETK